MREYIWQPKSCLGAQIVKKNTHYCRIWQFVMIYAFSGLRCWGPNLDKKAARRLLDLYLEKKVPGNILRGKNAVLGAIF